MKNKYELIGDILSTFLVFSCMGVMFLCGYAYGLPLKDTPTVLDVYRGKTTLEITYRDSVAVDSVVVYKVK